MAGSLLERDIELLVKAAAGDDDPASRRDLLSSSCFPSATFPILRSHSLNTLRTQARASIAERSHPSLPRSTHRSIPLGSLVCQSSTEG